MRSGLLIISLEKGGIAGKVGESATMRCTVLLGPPAMLESEGLRGRIVATTECCLLRLLPSLEFEDRAKSFVLVDVAVRRCAGGSRWLLPLEWKGPGAMVFILCRMLLSLRFGLGGLENSLFAH